MGLRSDDVTLTFKELGNNPAKPVELSENERKYFIDFACIIAYCKALKVVFIAELLYDVDTLWELSHTGIVGALDIGSLMKRSVLPFNFCNSFAAPAGS